MPASVFARSSPSTVSIRWRHLKVQAREVRTYDIPWRWRSEVLDLRPTTYAVHVDNLPCKQVANIAKHARAHARTSDKRESVALRERSAVGGVLQKEACFTCDPAPAHYTSGITQKPCRRVIHTVSSNSMTWPVAIVGSRSDPPTNRRDRARHWRASPNPFRRVCVLGP